MTMVQLAMPVEVDQGDVVTARITLPFLPPSKNVYDGWQPMWKSSAKKKWIREIGKQCEALQIPKGLTHIGLAARLVFATRARRDTQNYAQVIWHFVPDALQRCGVLVDDREGSIEWGPDLGVELAVDTRRIDPKRRQRTILTIAYEQGGIS